MKIDKFDILHLFMLIWAGYLAFQTDDWLAALIVIVLTGLLMWVHTYRRDE